MVMGTLNRPGSSDSAQYEVGDQVRPGQIFMKIMEPDSMQLACAVNQVEARLIEIGLRARVPLDAYPGLAFQGKLLKVGPWRSAAVGKTFWFFRSKHRSRKMTRTSFT